MSSHTPGPWRVYPFGTSVPHYDICPRVVSDNPSGRCSHEDPSDADAALIAAAPDLLALVKQALEALDVPDLDEAMLLGLDGWVMEARAAVSKAEATHEVPTVPSHDEEN